MAPYSGTGGVKPRLRASARTSSTAGSTPEPPAPIWFIRVTSMARPSSAGCSGPDPAAWLRSSRSPCSARSSSASPTFRFAPTPVVRPYTGRRVATSLAVSHAARAAATAPAATVTGASSRATAATPAHVSDAPSMMIPGRVISAARGLRFG